MAEVVRVAALTGFFAAMEALGADPAPLLREAGLSRKLLSSPEQTISARAAMRLLERGTEVTGCQTFGLRMAENRELADLGATSLLIAHQATLRDALAALRQFRNRINSTLIMHIEDIGDGVLIREDFSLSEPEPSRQSCDLALGVLARLCFSVLGEAWCPQLVCFAHEPPRPPNCRSTGGCSAAGRSSTPSSTALCSISQTSIAPTTAQIARWPIMPAGCSNRP